MMLLYLTTLCCALFSTTRALQLCEIEAAINALKTHAATATAENAHLKSKIEAIENQYATDVDALQWQMYHVGASAACSGVTYYQKLVTSRNRAGSTHNGWVYAHTARKTCKEVCAATSHKVCVNGVRVQGSYGAQTAVTTTVGHYYTLGCGWRNGDHYAENTRSAVKGVLKTNRVVHAHYCCCTVLAASWKIQDKVTDVEITSTTKDDKSTKDNGFPELLENMFN